MSRREHSRFSTAAQPARTQQNTENSGARAETAAPAPSPIAQTQPQERQPEMPPLHEDRDTPPHRAASNLRGVLSPPQDGIARTHAELVALERQGRRSYVEFALTRSKRFQAIGPVTLQLRKTDAKHNCYDLRFTVNGRQLQKKRVNLYEPVWITLDERTPPLELVVNGLAKNQVWGYLSEPRNRDSELAQRNHQKARAYP